MKTNMSKNMTMKIIMEMKNVNEQDYEFEYE